MLIVSFAAASFHSAIQAQPAVLFKNVKVFDGKSDELSPATSVLVVGNKISKIGGGITAPEKALVIDEGIVAGPRIYPCGAMITITSGHDDFRQKFELPRTSNDLSRIEQIGAAMIADSPDEVRRRTREQLMLGATQIKLTAGGGVASPHSPIDVSTFTEEELHAAVEGAENWGTCLTVHAYTSPSMQRAIAAGVRCIEHGHLMDEATAKLMAEKGIWLSIQPFLDDEDLPAFPEGSFQRAKIMEVVGGTDRAYRLAKTHSWWSGASGTGVPPVMEQSSSHRRDAGATWSGFR